MLRIAAKRSTHPPITSFQTLTHSTIPYPTTIVHKNSILRITPCKPTSSPKQFHSQLSKLTYYWQEDAGGNEFYINWKKNPVIWIIAANVAVFLLYLLSKNDSIGKSFFEKHFTLSVNNISRGYIHTLITSAFSHFDIMHILVNMFVLWQMAVPVMYYLGSPKRFVNFYFVAALMGSFGYLLEQIIRVNYYKRNTFKKSKAYYTAANGASGAVAACFAYFCRMSPHSIMNLYMVIPIPAMYLLYASFAFEVGHLLFFRDSLNIASSAHLGGLLFGVLAYRYRLFMPRF